MFRVGHVFFLNAIMPIYQEELSRRALKSKHIALVCLQSESLLYFILILKLIGSKMNITLLALSVTWGIGIVDA
jgi:hypothetical protein